MKDLVLATAMKLTVLMGLLVGLTACVAPEAPPVAKAPARPAISTAGFEDAPLPNHKMATPRNDSIIRMGN